MSRVRLPIGKKEDDDNEPIPMVERQIWGSSVLSNVIIIDNYKYKVLDIVKNAWLCSCYDLDSWNTLPWKQRDEMINAYIHYMRMHLEYDNKITWLQAVEASVKNVDNRRKLRVFAINSSTSLPPLPKPKQ